MSAGESVANGVTGALRGGASLAGKAVTRLFGTEAPVKGGHDHGQGQSHGHVNHSSGNNGSNAQAPAKFESVDPSQSAHYHLYYDGKKGKPTYGEALSKYG